MRAHQAQLLEERLKRFLTTQALPPRLEFLSLACGSALSVRRRPVLDLLEEPGLRRGLSLPL